MVRSASASTDSPSAVEPTTSQNSALTTLRCSRPRPSTRAPHAGQNLEESAASYPHAAQVATAGVYDQSTLTISSGLESPLREMMRGFVKLTRPASAVSRLA